MNDRSRASRFLEQTLLWNFLIHLAAMATMALIVLPGLPGGPSVDDATRIAYVADHPIVWRLGWIPWQLCALIDLLTGIALVWTRWIPRLPAVLTTLVTAVAVAVEQSGELSWVFRGVELAKTAHQTGDFALYLAFERWAYHYTVVLGASLYLVMALGWTWCFAAAGTWNRLLTWISPLAWGSLSVGSIGLYALGVRLFSEGMPMHLAKKAEVTAKADGSIRVVLDPGLGNAPDLDGTFQFGAADLPGPPWADVFANYQEFLAYCVPQDRAFSTQAWYGRISRQEIRIEIPLESCQPLAGNVRSEFAEAIIGKEPIAVSFHVPAVDFRFEGEWHEPFPRAS